jgi:hypothetical protein
MEPTKAGGFIIVKNIVSAIVSVFLIISASTLLPGCGDSGSSDSTGGGATYGALTLTGTGTVVTGTTFNAYSRLAITSSGITVTEWYNIDLAAGTTYPYVVLIVIQDSLGAITGVEISNMISSGTASGQWVISAPSTTEVSATAATVTFTNLVVPGYAAAGTTTSLTLNGTLKF